MIKEEQTTVEYHSQAWANLVETGWHTMTVDDDGAVHMLRLIWVVTPAQP